MNFDLEGARKAGASDDQIADFLAQQHGKFDLPAARKAGAKSAQVIPFLMEGLKARASAPPAPMQRRGGTRSEAKPFVASGAGITGEDLGDATKGLLGMGAESLLGVASQAFNQDAPQEPPRASVLDTAQPLSDETPAVPITPLENVSGVSIKPGAEQAYQQRQDARRAPAEVSPMPLGASIAASVRETTDNPVARGAVSGSAQIGQIGIGAMRLAADLSGADDAADFFGKASRTAGRVGSGSTVDLRGNEKLVADVTSSILNSAPAMTIGAVGGPAMRTLFAQSFFAEYNNGRDADFSPGESAKRAGIMALAEPLGERMGFPQQMELLKSIAKHVPTDRLAKVFGEMLMNEIPGEQLTTAMQFLADKAGPAALNPNATLADYLDQAGETLKLTIAQTGVMGGGPAAIGVSKNAYSRADRTTAAPEQLVAQAIDEAAATYGLSPKAAAALRDKVSTLPADKAVQYAERALQGFEKGNLVKKPGAATGFRSVLADKALAALDTANKANEEKTKAAETKKDTSLEDGLAKDLAERLGINLNASTILNEDFTGLDTAQATPESVAPTTEGEAPEEVTQPSSSEPAQLGVAAPSIEGEAINRNWSTFSPNSGTLGIPREQMPQIKAEHRGALTQFLNSRGIEHQSGEVSADELKPTQAEFSPRKVQQAAEFTGGDRSILVSNDGYIIDGTHQWAAKREAGEPVKVIVFNAPIQDLLRLAQQFPSSFSSKGPRNAERAEPGATAEVGPVDTGAGNGTEQVVQGELQQPQADRPPAGPSRSADERSAAVPAGRNGHPALTIGQAVELDGKPYLVKKLGKNTISLTGEDGRVRTISDSSVNWPRIKVVSDSSLNRDASWVIRNKATGEVIMETFDRKKVDALNTAKYEVVGIREYLASLNGKPAEGMKKPEKLTPEVNSGPRVIARAGVTPATATPLELRPNKDGTLTPFHEGHELLDFDSGNPVKLPAGVSNEDALAAIKQAGAFGRHTKVFRDEPSSSPPSPQTKADQAGSTKAGSTGAGPTGEDGVPSTRSTRSEAARVERSRLTPLDDPRLKTDASRRALEGARADIGWAQRGGELIRDPRTAIDPNSPNAPREGDVIGRTPWIGSDLWRERPEEGGKISEAEAHQAFDRALAGEPMTAKQKRFVQYALDREAERAWMPDAPAPELGALDPEVREATNRLLAEALARGLDIDALQEDAAKQTEGQSSRDYLQTLQVLIANETLPRDGGVVSQADAGATGPSSPGRGEDHGPRGPPAEGGQAGEVERFAAGRALTKEQRKKVLGTLVDVYKAKHAPRELKGLDSNGNERYGYVYSPDLFEKSDITGAMVRYHVSLPDGRIAHPSELFPNYTQADIDKAMIEQEAAERIDREEQARWEKQAERFGTATPEEAKASFMQRNRNFELKDWRTGKTREFAVMTKDGKFYATISDDTSLIARLERAGWVKADARPDLALTAETESTARSKADREAAALAEEKKAKEAEQRKAEADAQRDEFTLTGSNRPADVSMAGGQGDLLGFSGEETKQAADNAEDLRRRLVAVEDRIVGAAGLAPGFLEDALRSRKVPSDLKQERTELQQALREARGQAERAAAPAPTRPTETIELRKRLSVLNSLLECLQS